jgi:Protein of unknown function (DUF3662)/FHA domain
VALLQDSLRKIEEFMRGIFEKPFTKLIALQPIDISNKLKLEMDDNIQVQSEGRRLAPHVYDIFLSIEDHQRFAPTQDALIHDWQEKLVEFARREGYTLIMMPILRLHPDSKLPAGEVRIEVGGAETSNGGLAGGTGTQAISATQLAELRKRWPTSQPAFTDDVLPSQPVSALSPLPGPPASFAQPPMAVQMPQAWLIVKPPQGVQEKRRIEKPVMSIGRQLDNDVCTKDERVSRYHARIKYDSRTGLFTIIDLGSTNGITINGQQNVRQHDLRNGDKFTIGSYNFRFERR